MKGIEVWRKSSKSAVKGSGRKFNGVKPNERVVKCSWVKFK